MECLPSPFLILYHQWSFFISSSHLNLGLRLLLFPYCSLSPIFLTVLPWSIRTTGAINYSLFFLTSVSVSRSWNSTLNSWLLLILHIPCSTISPCIVLNIFLSHVPSHFIYTPFIAQVSQPYTATDLYILLAVALLMALEQNICFRR